MHKGHKVHFDFDHPEGRFTGDGIIVSRVRNDVKTILVEVERPGTNKILAGERLRIPKEDVVRTESDAKFCAADIDGKHDPDADGYCNSCGFHNPKAIRYASV